MADLSTLEKIKLTQARINAVKNNEFSWQDWKNHRLDHLVYYKGKTGRLRYRTPYRIIIETPDNEWHIFNKPGSFADPEITKKIFADYREGYKPSYLQKKYHIKAAEFYLLFYCWNTHQDQIIKRYYLEKSSEEIGLLIGKSSKHVETRILKICKPKKKNTMLTVEPTLILLPRK